MFINAEPRIVSGGFETSVPLHGAEVLHQRLVEMTNNQVNAWSNYRPLASSSSGSWNQQGNDFSNENFSVQNQYGGYFHDTSLAVPRQHVDYSKASSYAYTPVPSHPTRKLADAQQTYQTSVVNCVQKQSPMLGHDYSQWGVGHRSSFSEFSRAGDVLKNGEIPPSIESNVPTYTPVSSAQSLQPAYHEEMSSLNASYSMDGTSPSTVHSSYSPLTIPQVVHNLSTKMGWWSETLGNDAHNQGIDGFAFSYDGLPSCKTPPRQQQPYSDVWNVGNQTVDNWATQAIAPNTISPKLLRLNDSSVSLSSTGSSQGMLGLSGPSTAASSTDALSVHSGPETSSNTEPPERSRTNRQMLPDSGSNFHRIVPVLPSNDFKSGRNPDERSTKIVKSGNNVPRSSSPMPTRPNTPPSTRRRSSLRLESGPSRSRAPTRIMPKPVVSSQPRQTWNSLSSEMGQQPTHHRESIEASESKASARVSLPQSTTLQARHFRTSADDFLISARLAGKSYKEIRREGKFNEAESTLRGRFRALTKHPAARVRKPEWEDNDIRLLKRAVRKLTPPAYGSDPKVKVPWKAVAEYIADHGGSYHFGNATCRKRWDELQGRSED